MEKIVDSFTNQLTYAFEQLSKGVYESGPEMAAHAGMGLWGLNHVRGVLTSVQDALVKRGIELDPHSGIVNLYEEVRYPLEKLEGFLKAKHAGEKASLDEEAASIYVSFLRTKLDELREIARDVDKKHES